MKVPALWGGPLVLALSVGCKMASSEDAGPFDAGGGAGQSPTADVRTIDVNRPPSVPGETIIQEGEIGFDAIDGNVSTSVAGYTGLGFADSDPGVGKTISWSVKADAEGPYSLVFRYAFGGAAENVRDARLRINGQVAAEMVAFPHTTTWDNWQETPPLGVPLSAGSNFIQLEALAASGLANIDYLKILGFGIQPDTPSFSVTVGLNDSAGGIVSYSPVLDYYPYGSMVTVTAAANPGYFFQSWMGDAPSAKAVYALPVVKNTVLTARFLPDGAAQDPALLGYAGVQDDNGTPYLLTGGSLGPSVMATSVDELKMYLGSPMPYVVSFSGLFEGPDNIAVASDKTLLGVGDSAHLMGIELEINGSRNVIIRNVAVSHVVADGSGIANDAIEITGGAKNIWIDHCELFSDLLHDKDFYDGLLDIKNQSSFITVSWCAIHDHWKASLISSGDEQFGDAAIRATYHHNYFHDCGSRLPSIRFGKAHIFNNYYRNNPTGSCVDSRMGAVVKVESNFFETSKNTIGWFEGPATGSWDVANNVFLGCTGSQPTDSTGHLTPPYRYSPEAAAGLPTTIPAGAGLGKQ